MSGADGKAAQDPAAGVVGRHSVLVEWGDCDPAGIVYYPAYFRWFDQATYRLFLAAGLARDALEDGQWREGTPLVEARCAFRRPSRHGETLAIESRVSRWGRSSFTIAHTLRDAAGAVAAEGHETRIWARKSDDGERLEPVPVPARVRRALGGPDS